MDNAEFMRGLVRALPEAFADLDVEREYFDTTDGSWLVYLALAHARDWIEERALTVHRRRQAVEIRREDALRRFFQFMESCATGADRDMRNLLMIELFEGTPWTENVLGFLGPETVALLRAAQVELAPYNSSIGRWDET